MSYAVIQDVMDELCCALWVRFCFHADMIFVSSTSIEHTNTQNQSGAFVQRHVDIERARIRMPILVWVLEDWSLVKGSFVFPSKLCVLLCVMGALLFSCGLICMMFVLSTSNEHTNTQNQSGAFVQRGH